MTSKIGRSAGPTKPAVPAPETQWEILRDVWDRVEHLEERSGQVDQPSGGERISEQETSYRTLLSRVFKVVSDMEVWVGPQGISFDLSRVFRFSEVLGQCKRVLAADILQKRTRQSIVSEYRTLLPNRPLTAEIEHLRSASEAFVSEFEDSLARINRHTDLCQASRRLRETARANRNTPFYWALVDVHDCIHASVPEEMSRPQAETLATCIDQLSPGMSEEKMLEITDALFSAGLRPWRPSSKKRRRKRTASGARR